jgi:hypothetical protein
MAGCKTKNEKPQAPSTPSITYTADISNLAVTQRMVRGFGGATVFRPELSNAVINALSGNANNSQPGLIILRTRVSSNAKILTAETAINVTGSFFMYNLTSLYNSFVSDWKQKMGCKEDGSRNKKVFHLLVNCLAALANSNLTLQPIFF